MSRKLVGVAVACFVGVGLAFAADEITSARVKALDFQKNTITVTIGDKDQIFPVHKDAKFFRVIKKKGDVGTETPLNSLNDVPLGAIVTLTVEKVNFKDTVTTIKVGITKKSKKSF
jgi:hypothetical protein